MTTLYRPVLIESAEQAEALPLNTMAISADGVDPAIRKEDGWRGIFGDPPYSHAEMVSDYALVPIEAEEVWSARQPYPGGGTRGRTNFGVHESLARQHCETVAGDVVEHRLVTPWEEA